MTAAIGVDPQRSRSSIVLRESSGLGTQISVVGDGRRRLIPNAWGGGATEDPWDPEFLRGIRGRLSQYLGVDAGYRITLAVPLEKRVLEVCAAAGLTGVGCVDPADALLCRWLSEPVDGAWRGRVSVAVVGETRTWLASYQVNADQSQVRRLPGARSVPYGSGAWCAELRRMVLDRCGEGAVDPVAVLDGVYEFGAALDPVQPTQWRGPLAERMFTPLRLSRAEMLAWPSVREVTGALRELEGQVVVGGVGAIWPFYDRAWRSDAPEHDLAVGAAWWPELAPYFSGLPVPAAEPATFTGQDEGTAPWLRSS
ncbi:hypothetical protein Aph01nite_77430 [Acrocarpospora phusangensis]|uniref:Uncharacterized protein n=1 Tax=Acrocarpospora phusangensis TaxID=1070424 RepID=A0A919UT73_9ACTN|nr:hypothetical protein [Acrocarpospora phusangensis]GIH29433.1 hypothetical protein Aph01nite_77430 [Acrocarpospora phusangensis]